VTSPVINITELLVFCLPFLKVLAIVAIIVAATVYLFRARSARQWLTICMRIAGAVLVVPLVVVLPFLLFVLMVGCTSRSRVLVSPDSQHVAEYRYQPGFLGRDSTFVTVRNKWSISPKVIYQYAGPGEWDDTEVQWLSNERLLVRYSPDRSGHFQQCKTGAASVVVQCEVLR
jgi:hypothetical protein